MTETRSLYNTCCVKRPLKRWTISALSALIATALVAFGVLRLSRPRNEVAVLVENILDLAEVASWKGFEGPEADRLEMALEDLSKK
jgi:hypothetical protein